MIYIPKVFTLREGDILPILEATLLNPDGSVHDYTGASTFQLRVKLWPLGTIFVRNMVAEGLPTGGKVRYSWLAADWNQPGGLVVGPIKHPEQALKPGEWEHAMYFRVDGKLTFPNGGFDILRILPAL
jgi:hypothetical protein